MKLTQNDINAFQYAKVEAISNAEFDGNYELVKALEVAFDKILTQKKQ